MVSDVGREQRRVKLALIEDRGKIYRELKRWKRDILVSLYIGEVDMLQVLSCNMDTSPELLESAEVAANIHNGWHNTITPDNGKLLVGQGSVSNRI